jgi:hypothetical protein
MSKLAKSAVSATQSSASKGNRQPRLFSERSFPLEIAVALCGHSF